MKGVRRYLLAVGAVVVLVLGSAGIAHAVTGDPQPDGDGQPYGFEKYINGQEADTFVTGVLAFPDVSLTFKYEVVNTGNVPIEWTSLTDDVFGDLTSECGLPRTIPVGGSDSCEITRPAGFYPHGKQNIGTVSVAGLDDQSDPAWYLVPNCVYSLSYWKAHPEAWPVETLTLGTRTYTKAELLSILNQPAGGNGMISMAHQLIAAKLNAQNGAPVPTRVMVAILAADALIGRQVVPPVGRGWLPPALTAGLTNTLTRFNDGLWPGGPAACGD